MKTTAFQILHGLYGLVFYSFVVGATCIVVLQTVDLIKGDHTIKYSLSEVNEEKFVPTDSLRSIPVRAKSNAIKDASVIPDSWNLTFTTSGLSIQYFMALAKLMTLIYLFMILYTLRKFIYSLKQDMVFALDNIKRLQRLGILLVLIDPLRLIVDFIRSTWIKSYFDAFQNQESVGYTLGYKVGYTLGSGGFILQWTLTGLIVIVIAQVFKQALKIKEEHELTV